MDVVIGFTVLVIVAAFTMSVFRVSTKASSAAAAEDQARTIMNSIMGEAIVGGCGAEPLTDYVTATTGVSQIGSEAVSQVWAACSEAFGAATGEVLPSNPTDTPVSWGPSGVEQGDPPSFKITEGTITYTVTFRSSYVSSFATTTGTCAPYEGSTNYQYYPVSIEHQIVVKYRGHAGVSGSVSETALEAGSASSDTLAQRTYGLYTVVPPPSTSNPELVVVEAKGYAPVQEYPDENGCAWFPFMPEFVPETIIFPGDHYDLSPSYYSVSEGSGGYQSAETQICVVEPNYEAVSASVLNNECGNG